MKYTHIFKIMLIMVTVSIAVSCEKEYDLPEAGSFADETPPSANFTASEDPANFQRFLFSNLSNSSTDYFWDFGDGNTSTERDPENTYPAEGTYTVTLTATDALDVSSTFSMDINVVEPEPQAVPDPVLKNADFDKIEKLGGSDCSCSGWDNDDIGEQGESSSGNGGSDNVVKFDNNEPDHVYQEFEVVPNSDYTIQVVSSFKDIDPTTPFPGSMLELRILAGSGYVDGYTPTYYATAPEYPNSGYGYTTVAQVEEASNNLIIETISNPGNDDYLTQTFTFNSGANASVALFIRGIGGDSSVGSYGYTSGDEEIRVDSVTISANE
jgi:PKD repeat protein